MVALLILLVQSSLGLKMTMELIRMKDEPLHHVDFPVPFPFSNMYIQ